MKYIKLPIHLLRLRALLFLLLNSILLPVIAQELTVKSFEQTTDAIARARNVEGTDGKVCAAVVVRIPVATATFEGSYIIGKPEYKNGEYILDMQTGAAQMRVSVPGFNTIDVKFREYLDGKALQSKTTYLLTINVPGTGIIDDDKQQNVRFKLIPAMKAKIKINGITFDTEADGTKTIPLAIGRMPYSVSADGYYDSEGVVETHADAGTQTVNVDLKHRQGTLDVRVSQAGATVKLDGVVLGRSPMNKLSVDIGTHTLEVSCPNYRTETRQVSIKDKETSVLQVNLVNTTEFTIKSSPTGSKLYVDNAYKGETPYKIELPSGEYTIKLTHDKYKTFSKRVHLDSSNPLVQIKMSEQYQRRSNFYMQASYQVGGLSAPSFTLGTYICNFNIEVTSALGLSKSEDIYWSSGQDNTSSRPNRCNYSPLTAGMRLGYGVVVGTRLRFTPQLGGTWLRISSKGTYSDEIWSTCVFGSFGLRTECILARHLGLSLSPEYCFAVGQSDNFKKLADLSSTIKGWASGFNLRFGVFVCF